MLEQNVLSYYNVQLCKDKLYIFKICDLVQFIRKLNC